MNISCIFFSFFLHFPSLNFRIQIEKHKAYNALEYIKMHLNESTAITSNSGRKYCVDSSTIAATGQFNIKMEST